MARGWFILVVAIGGAAGALLRWGITLGMGRWAGSYTLGTFAANILGCFAAGVGYVLLAERTGASPLLRLAIMVGFLGALTTFSTWSLESAVLIDQHRYAAAAANILGSLLLGLAATFTGIALAHRLS